MSTSLRQRAEELFHQSLALPAHERQALLDRECAGDSRLRERVTRLLRHADSGPDGTIDRPLFSLAAAPHSLPLNMPERIGRYHLVRLIGEGGMGAVYEARQESPERTVALKVIRAGLATRAVFKRFQQECQVLGRLSHPGIAQIYEAGVVDRHGHLIDPAATGAEHEQRQPFFAMELIHGVPIDRYAEAKSLGTRDRLSLVALVADAIEHAHQHGIIHRDLKPGNVLVDEVNGVARPRVLDFGVAHVADSEQHSATLRTGVGELIGTLAYMSPEQATGDVDSLDSRADVYSLGVLAFQLLSGRLPLDLARRAIPEAARVIREEEPSKLGSLNTLFRGDVETIVAKALEKDRTRRYQSAREFAADIRRFLHDEPIIARRAGTLYQLRKFAQRNRGLVAGIAAAFAALTIGLVGMAILAVKERRQRQVAVSKTAESDRRAYRAGIAAALAALEQDDVALASSSLRAAPEALRGWEWRHLMSRAESTVLQLTIAPPPSSIALFRASPDARTLVTCSGDHRIRFWDGLTGAPLRTLAYDPEIREFALTPGADRILVTRTDGVVEMLDATSGARLWGTPDTLRHNWPANLSRDGALVSLTTDEDGTVLVFDAARGEVVNTIRMLSGPPGPIFSADHSRVALSGGAQGSAVLYDTIAARVLWGIPTGWFSDLTHDGRRAVVIRRSSPRGSVSVVAADSGEILDSFELPDPGEYVTAAFRPDGTVVSTVGLRRRVQIRDTTSLTSVITVDAGAPAFVTGYTTDGSRLYTLGSNGLVRHWDGHLGPMPMTIPFPLGIFSAAFSADRRLAAIGDWGSVSLWDTTTGRLLWMRCISIREVRAVTLSPDGKHLVADAAHGSIALLDAADGRVLFRSAPARQRPVSSLTWAADGPFFLVGFNDGTALRIDSGAPDRPSAAMPLGSAPLVQLQISPDTKLLAAVQSKSSESAATPTSSVLVQDLGYTTKPRVLSHPDGSVLCCAFSPDSTFIATGGNAPSIRIWKAAAGELVSTLPLGTSAAVRCLLFTPDARRLAAGCDDQTIRLWDLGSLEEIAVLHADARMAIAFSPERDALLAIGGRGATVFETQRTTPDALETREHIRQARSLLSPLLEEQYPHEKRLLGAVTVSLHANPFVTPSVLAAADAFLNARGDHAPEFNGYAWGLVSSRNNLPEKYDAALRMVTVAAAILPDNASVLNTLGTAQVRTRHFAEAVATFDRCTQLRAADGEPPDPADLAMQAIALHALGRTAEAQAALDESRRRFEAPGIAKDLITLDFINQAAELLK